MKFTKLFNISELKHVPIVEHNAIVITLVNKILNYLNSEIFTEHKNTEVILIIAKCIESQLKILNKFQSLEQIPQLRYYEITNLLIQGDKESQETTRLCPLIDDHLEIDPKLLIQLLVTVTKDLIMRYPSQSFENAMLLDSIIIYTTKLSKIVSRFLRTDVSEFEFKSDEIIAIEAQLSPIR